MDLVLRDLDVVQVAERVVGQRDEPLLVPAGAREPQLAERRHADPMNGAGPQTNASHDAYAAANARTCSRVGSPCTDSSQCTTCSRSGCAAARAASSAAKITDDSSRLA